MPRDYSMAYRFAAAYLVLEVYRRVEVRDLGIDALAHHLALARVDELAHLEDCRWGTEIALSVTTTSATA
jgi:hypothetical protein